MKIDPEYGFKMKGGGEEAGGSQPQSDKIKHIDRRLSDESFVICKISVL